ncbi:MAG: hypothetical protein ACLGSD_02325 [Acidobacteriota bacterium]
MRGRTGYLVIAALLTILDAAEALRYGVTIWGAWPGGIWDRGLSLLLAVLGASSLVNVWVQAIFRSSAWPGSRNEEYVQGVVPIAAEARGPGNV